MGKLYLLVPFLILIPGFVKKEWKFADSMGFPWSTKSQRAWKTTPESEARENSGYDRTLNSKKGEKNPLSHWGIWEWEEIEEKMKEFRLGLAGCPLRVKTLPGWGCKWEQKHSNRTRGIQVGSDSFLISPEATVVEAQCLALLWTVQCPRGVLQVGEACLQADCVMASDKDLWGLPSRLPGGSVSYLKNLFQYVSTKNNPLVS